MDRVRLSFLPWMNDNGRHQLAEGACRANVNRAGLCCDDVGELLHILAEAPHGLRMEFNDVRRRLACGELSLQSIAFLPQWQQQR
ncbi:hypothetical protein PYH37_005263 [Sinorhizobium numidicum]|uniref:Uncharacterized protein n=1 Tax=Sinorhizobium numidicum TaxID=680248 RepID=A0ABY8CY45_9HYPH|nr:hypothetical protein [Sinorhizobium numidicum]WEX76911.1 hypothetical protein PYH37_005263 [Sinorhizobium numidicum]WEX83570.1 hypothetical protein PYH38_002356 [Sinorhizobium numidicum]